MPTTIPDDLGLYPGDFLATSGWADSTLRNGVSVMRMWVRWTTASDVDLLGAKAGDLRKFLAEREATPVAPATLHKSWQIVTEFYAWAARPPRRERKDRPGAGLLRRDPMLDVDEPFVPEHGPKVRYAETDDVFTLLAYFDRLDGRGRTKDTHARARRNAAMVSVMLRSGVRVGELPWFDLDDLIFDERGELGGLLVGGFDGSHTKSRKSRIVPLVHETPERLNTYLRARGREPGPLFLARETPASRRTNPTRRLTAGAIREMVERACKVTGVTLSPHDLRRAWALEGAEDGHDRAWLMSTGGWTKPETLDRYIGQARQRIAAEQLRAAIDGTAVRKLKVVR